ncbi:MAG: GNAT family N-acetyltransferase [Xanthomonadales bacterium]|nr:GNAT family N-acetyltransferase [Xanthomonadales bacterium]
MNAAESALAPGACRLTLGNEAHSAALACALARAFAAQLGFGEAELGAIELGLEEAVSNVVRHAFPADERHDFELLLQATPLGLEILIRDQGLPFDPTRVPDYDPAAAPDTQMRAGLGMHLMRQAFDAVEYRNLGRGGKETRLLRHRDLVPIGERRLPAAAEPPAEEVSEIRLLRPDDALEVARLIHEAYGYSYPYEHIYFPERIAALNAAGELCSALALTPSGRIAGHAALVIDAVAPERAELAIVVTRMHYRGQGVARRIGEFLVECARERGLRMLFTHAVTAHPYTQQFMHQLGFRDTALLPGHAPASLRFRKIADALGQRESCMYAVRYLDQSCRGERVATLPAAHREPIRSIYAGLGIPLREVEPAAPPALPPRADINVAVHGGLELAQLRLERWGADALEVLRARLAAFRRERMAVVELGLPLCDALTAERCAEVEALGFVFSGVIPGATPEEDRLAFDFVADPGFDYDAPRIWSELGQRLREHVRAAASAA